MATDKDIKKELDKLYDTGFNNGSIEMKNKIMKSLNRDWRMFTSVAQVKLLIKILKKIDKIKIKPC